MRPEEASAASAPWTTRQVWSGVVFVVLWMALATVLVALIKTHSWDLNLGLFVAVAELPLLLPVWWFAVHKYRLGWRGLGLRGFDWGDLGLGCGLMLLSLLFNLFYGAFLAIFGLRAQVDLTPIFAGLSARYGWQKAIVASSALFALVHLQPLAFLPIFILGLIFAYLYHRSRSLWPAILMHVSPNALALGAAYLVARMGLTTKI